MPADPQDGTRHAGHVIRRVLLRRNIAIDPETAQLVADAVQAALRAGAPPGMREEPSVSRSGLRCWPPGNRPGLPLDRQ